MSAGRAGAEGGAMDSWTVEKAIERLTYKLNAFERASQARHPGVEGYATKRVDLFKTLCTEFAEGVAAAKAEGVAEERARLVKLILGKPAGGQALWVAADLAREASE